MPFLLLSVAPFSAVADWVEYSVRPNGDVHFYDSARVERSDGRVGVWHRIRYMTSVMGASSFEEHLEIDCAGKSQVTSKTTFYSDKDWTRAAMATSMKAKPQKEIREGSAMAQLVDIVCAN